MLRILSALVITSGFSSLATAELFRVPPSPPVENLEEILEGIEENLSEAQCGGWDFNVSMEATVPRVEGVPGRAWIVDGNVLSHMAQRVENRETAVRAVGEGQADQLVGIFSDGFLFPHTDEVLGLSTTCRIADLGDGFVDPGRLHNCRSPEECRIFCKQLNQWMRPICIDPRTGNKMQTRCQLNVRGNIDGCAVGESQGWEYCCSKDLNGNPVPVTNHNFNIDPEVEGQGESHPDANRNCTVCRGDGAGNPQHFINDEDFNGDSTDRVERDEMGCRWGKEILPILGQPLDPPGDSDIPRNTTALPPTARNQYQSFYRKFTGSHSRPQALHATDTFARDAVEIACYGPYQEYDPKRTRALTEEIAGVDEPRIQGPVPRCVIGTDYTQMRETQSNVKREGLQELEDPPFAEEPRPFDEEEDLWMPIGGALSVVNGEVFSEEFDSDLMLAVTAVDRAELRTTVQQTLEVPLSQGRLVRAYDYTVDSGRIFTEDPDQRHHSRTYPEWVQWTQTQMSRLFRPPVVRVMFPTTWVYGLHPSNHPLSRLQDVTTSGTRQGPNQSIEVQLGIKPSSLDWIAQTIKDLILLNVTEVPVPFTLPVGDPVELDVAARNWCLYYIEQTGEPVKCSDVPGTIGELIDQLDTYAEKAEKTRVIREELPGVLARLLTVQRSITAPVDRWLNQNMDVFEEIDALLSERQEFLGEQDFEEGEEEEEQQEQSIAQLWEDFSMELLRISDSATYSWCRNEGFLPEIYSTLDRWLPGRPELTGLRMEFEDCIRGDASMEECLEEIDGLPIFDIGPPRDIVIDLTAIKIPVNAVRLPVFKPVQVALEIPTPKWELPIEEQDIVLLPDFDDIEIPTVAELIDQIIPEVEVERGPSTITTIMPEIDTLQEMLVSLDDVQHALTRSIEILEELRESEERFFSSIMPPQRPDPLRCAQYDDPYCFRSEMDLKEQLARLGAPPAFVRRADLLAAGPELRRPIDETTATAYCTEEENRDWTCLPVPSHTTYPREGWQVELKGQRDVIHEFRRDVFELSLPLGDKEQEELLPYRLKRDSTERTRAPLIPSYHVPNETELILQFQSQDR